MAYDKKAANQRYYKEHKQKCDEQNSEYRKKNMKRVPLDVQNDWYTLLKECCETNNVKSINRLIQDSCEEKARRDYGFSGFEEYHDTRKRGTTLTDDKTDTITQTAQVIPELAILYNYVEQ